MNVSRVVLGVMVTVGCAGGSGGAPEPGHGTDAAACRVAAEILADGLLAADLGEGERAVLPTPPFDGVGALRVQRVSAAPLPEGLGIISVPSGPGVSDFPFPSSGPSLAVVARLTKSGEAVRGDLLRRASDEGWVTSSDDTTLVNGNLVGWRASWTTDAGPVAIRLVACGERGWVWLAQVGVSAGVVGVCADPALAARCSELALALDGVTEPPPEITLDPNGRLTTTTVLERVPTLLSRSDIVGRFTANGWLWTNPPECGPSPIDPTQPDPSCSSGFVGPDTIELHYQGATAAFTAVMENRQVPTPDLLPVSVTESG